VTFQEVVLLVVIGVVAGAILLLLPTRNKGMEAIVREASAAQLGSSISSFESEKQSTLRRIQHATYWSKGIAPPSKLLLAVAVLLFITGTLLLAIDSVGIRLSGLGLLVIGPAIVYLDVTFRVSRRQKVFQDELPPFLLLVASAMSVGLTLEQSFAELSSGRSNAVEEEFHQISQNLSVGRSLESSLEELAQRMASPDITTLSRATAIGRQMGGSLTPILEAVAESALERAQVRREITTLTAEGMMSAYVLIALPIVIFLFLLLTQPDYVAVFWTTTEGLVMLGGTAVLIILGWVWLKNLIGRETANV
jgi:tight adherence protein B